MTDYPDQVNEMQASYQVNSREDETAVYRIPPHSVEAEQSVLGGLMLDNAAFDKIADVIGDGDFYREDHRRIYQAIIKLVEHNRPADVITVKEALDTTNDLTYVGGLAYLGIIWLTGVFAPSDRQIFRDALMLRSSRSS